MESRKVAKAEQQPAAANMMERLPQEVVIGILSRLPITSLIQSKLVCRAWQSLIQDPLLASEHFSRMADNGPSFILQSYGRASYQLYFTDLSCDSQGNLISKKLPNPFTLMSLVDSCNGLLCMQDSQAIYICNPFTKVSIGLPKFFNFPTQLGRLELGFHPTTKQYKLVQTIYRRQIPVQQRGNPTNVNESTTLVQYSEVNVLTIGSPAWRNLGTIPHRFVWRASKVLVNGKLHWLSGPRRYSWACLLISFDLETEQFQEVAKPDCCVIGKCLHQLTVLRGCLSVAAHHNRQLDVWVMKEYGVKEPWVKEFSIGTFMPETLQQVYFGRRLGKYFPNSRVRVVCILKSGELLLEWKRRSHVLYDQEEGTFKELRFPEMSGPFKIFVHVGSLSWLDIPINI